MQTRQYASTLFKEYASIVSNHFFAERSIMHLQTFQTFLQIACYRRHAKVTGNSFGSFPPGLSVLGSEIKKNANIC